MSKLGFSLSDLQQGAKSLNNTEVNEHHESKADAEERRVALEKLEEVYIRLNGDLDAIFKELKSDPTKAKKPHNRPHDAQEFARKYYEGFYSIISHEDDAAADSKSHK